VVIAWRFPQSSKNAAFGQKSGEPGDASADANQRRHNVLAAQKRRSSAFRRRAVVVRTRPPRTNDRNLRAPRGKTLVTVNVLAGSWRSCRLIGRGARSPNHFRSGSGAAVGRIHQHRWLGPQERSIPDPGQNGHERTCGVATLNDASCTHGLLFFEISPRNSSMSLVRLRSFGLIWANRSVYSSAPALSP
jgi:hypothetical protein